jgi:predicted transcriptional regulator
MVGENQDLFDLSEWRKSKEKPVSPVDEALSRVSEIEARLLRNLENRVHRGERLTSADYKQLEGLRAKLSARREAETPEGFVRTAREVAEHFKRTERTVRNWAGRGMPQEVDGYDLLKIEKWALAEGVIREPVTPGVQQAEGEALGDQEGAGALDRSHYELEIKRLDSELKALKLAKETGELIRREEVERGWYDRAFEFKRDLLGMARRLSLKGAGKEPPELYELIRQDAMEILGKYARGHVEVEALPEPETGRQQNSSTNSNEFE